jgi:molybdopterin synthase catalytic subunit
VSAIHVSIQTADFDQGREVAALHLGRVDVGAVVSFVGIVRQWLPDTVAASLPDNNDTLTLEHYPGMTERMLQDEAQRAAVRFGVLGIRLIHRVGELPLGGQIVLVAVAAPHRQAAFDACNYLMDWLKTQAPFWKKETRAGQGQWVAARDADDHALQRWQTPSALNAVSGDTP